MYCTLQYSKGPAQRGLRGIGVSVTPPIDAKPMLEAPQSGVDLIVLARQAPIL